MSGHTPGPWQVFTAKDGHKIIGIGEVTGEGVADCGFGVWRGGSNEALANARLIAAAPDLLAAAKQIDHMALVIESAVREDQRHHLEQVVEGLLANRAAIAKAEGRS